MEIIANILPNILIIAGVIGLLYEIVQSFRESLSKLNKYIEERRKKTFIIRYDLDE